MTKEEYIDIKRDGKLMELIWITYEDRFDETIHKPKLTKAEVYNLLLQMGRLDSVLKALIVYYDGKLLIGETQIIR